MQVNSAKFSPVTLYTSLTEISQRFLTTWCLWMQISGVVYLFRYPPQTALAVGLSMAQIGEFAFVLLSVASQLGLMPYQVYMLLMGEHLYAWHALCPALCPFL